ncbi:MFS transporter [Candidatus Gottesmanbacteria bacterium]|nr:MFS transporter [Candidatus Gottesmanbacteria bacterium]
MKNKALLTIFLVVFIDLLGFGIILPLLPFIAEKYSANPLQIGLLTATYSLFQLLATPVFGRLSDRFGRKKLLILSQLGSVAGYLLLGFANSLPLLFLARIIDGATGGNISVAQAYIADVTDKRNRARGMGLISAAFGLGFIIGPAVGGLLSVYGFAAPAFAAAGVGLVTVLATALFLKETVNTRAALHSPRTAFSWKEIKRVLGLYPIGLLIGTFFILNFAFSVMQGNFALFTQAAFHFGARDNGWLFAYMGVLIVIIQLWVLPMLVKRTHEKRLLLVAIASLATAFILLPIVPAAQWMWFIMLFFAFGNGLSNPTIMAIASEHVPKEEYGETLGIVQSAGSLGRIVGPVVGGELFFLFGRNVPFFFAAGLAIFIGTYLWVKLR